MPEPELTVGLFFALLLVAVGAGIFAAMLGLGGGILMVPALTLAFHVPIHEAYAASLLGVVAISSAGAVTFVRDGYTDIRIGLILGAATASGAFTGAMLATQFSGAGLALLFASVLGIAALTMLRDPTRNAQTEDEIVDAYAPPPQDQTSNQSFALNGDFHDEMMHRDIRYQVSRFPLGLSGSFVAGNLAGLMGGGGGIVMVPLMNLVMGVPLKAAVATSNFMLGITGVSAALVLYSQGLVNPVIAAPAILGMLIGAQIGSRLTVALPALLLRRALFVVLLFVASQMFYRVVTGGF